MIDGTVLVLIPTRRRTDRLLEVAANVLGATPEPHQVVFVVEADEVNDTIDVLGGPHRYRRWADVIVNQRKGHQGAYNTALQLAAREPGWTWWFHGADDLRFHDGWLTKCAPAMDDPGVAVVGTNDGLYASEKIATHYLVRRTYTERVAPVPGVEAPAAYFEGFHHQFVETEFVDVARERGAFWPELTAQVEHLHYLAGKAERDAGYADAEAHHAEDRALYLRRKKERSV